MADHESKVSLKLLIDKTRNKVLFADAGKDLLVDLLAFLGNLYASIENLSDSYLQTKETKDSLLKPKLIPSSASHVLRLMLPNNDQYAVPVPKKIYICKNCYSDKTTCMLHATDHPQAICPSCEINMNYAAIYAAPLAATTTSEERGFVKGLVTFKVTDDLVVTPMADFAKLINEFGVKEIENVEERVVHLGMEQGLMLLKETLRLDTVLTNVFLLNQQPPV